MRAAIVEQVPGVPTIDELEVDAPGVGEVLLRVAACGVCHSDVHALHGSHMAFPVPFVPGHEPAGVVEAVGPGVRHLSPGDPVVASLTAFCGHCARCLSGEPIRCTAQHETARTADAPPRLRRGDQAVHAFVGVGGFAERMLVHQHNVVAIDPALPLERACLLGCGVMTGFGAVANTARVTAGATVAVLGCGGVGLAAIQAARIAHASRIVAVDVDGEKLELARRCGASDVVDATRDEPVAAVQALVPGGVDHAFEAIGRPDTARQALALTGPGGTLTMVGLMAPGDTLTVGGMDLMMGKTVQQSLMGSGRLVVDIPQLVEHALAGRLDLDVMVGRERPLDELPAALAELEAGASLGRTVITFAPPD